MNARIGLVCYLLSATGCASFQSPTPAQREEAINAALTSAYVACKVALADPQMTWEDGAKSYCSTIVAGGCKEPTK